MIIDTKNIKERMSMTDVIIDTVKIRERRGGGRGAVPIYGHA